MQTLVAIIQALYSYNTYPVDYNAAPVGDMTAPVSYITAPVRSNAAPVRYITAPVNYNAAPVGYIGAAWDGRRLGTARSTRGAAWNGPFHTGGGVERPVPHGGAALNG